MASHAQIARHLTTKIPTGIFATACRDGVIHNDYRLLERMLPGVRYACRKLGTDSWELVGTCEDGSVIIWEVGG